MKGKKRKIDVLVLSDIHLGTIGCRADELNAYLKTIKPKTVILNGDIIDGWQFNKRYFPISHMRIIKQLMAWLSKGVTVYYISGNHDEVMRRFKGFQLGGLKIVNQLRLRIDGKNYWFFHGDVFDIVMKYSKWLAKLGGYSYDLLILLNTFINRLSLKMGRGRVHLSKSVKDGVKSVVKFVDDFETTAARMAIRNKMDYVACGHIHAPQIKNVAQKDGQVIYLNSGDWIENMSSLEYKKGVWSVYYYEEDKVAQALRKKQGKKDKKPKLLFQDLVEEFKMIEEAKAELAPQD